MAERIAPGLIACRETPGGWRIRGRPPGRIRGRIHSQRRERPRYGRRRRMPRQRAARPAPFVGEDVDARSGRSRFGQERTGVEGQERDEQGAERISAARPGRRAPPRRPAAPQKSWFSAKQHQLPAPLRRVRGALHGPWTKCPHDVGRPHSPAAGRHATSITCCACAPLKWTRPTSGVNTEIRNDRRLPCAKRPPRARRRTGREHRPERPPTRPRTALPTQHPRTASPSDAPRAAFPAPHSTPLRTPHPFRHKAARPGHPGPKRGERHS